MLTYKNSLFETTNLIGDEDEYEGIGESLIKVTDDNDGYTTRVVRRPWAEKDIREKAN